MFYGVSHLDISVTNLARARQFYSTLFGFPVKVEGPGFLDVDANSLCLRLIETKRVEQRANLRVQVSDVERAFAQLVAQGAQPLYQPIRTPQLELVASIADPDGNTVHLWRALSEDEYDFLPDLPKAQAWEGDAEALLQSLLLRVPSLFRALARRKVSREAEELARGRDVDREDVIRAYIRSSARITRYRLTKPLMDHGIDPAGYQADFES